MDKLLAAMACSLSLLATQAKAVMIDTTVTIEFDAIKVTHDCVDNFGFGLPNPGDGNCGFYQDVPLGESFAASISLTGTFETTDLLDFHFVDGDSTCSFGCVLDTGALGGFAGRFTPDSIYLAPFSYVFSTAYQFDLTDNTGFARWEGDSMPFFSRGRFEFSNVSVTGLEPVVARTSVPASVPLPASGVPLIFGLALLFGLSRRASGSRRRARWAVPA